MSTEPIIAKETKPIELFGPTRAVVSGRYALLTPTGFTPSSLPGWENSRVVVLVSPAMGARFCQFLITLEKDGAGRGNTGKTEFFVYVVEGNPSVTLDLKRNRLEPGSFVYIPPNKDIHFQGSNSRLLVFQRIYQPLHGTTPPVAIVSHQREVKSVPLSGNPDVKLQALAPVSPAFDLGVNVVTLPPGAMLPAVATQVEEYGLMMLQGQGIWRLEADYHPVQAGDALWLAPYCPHWFAALGKTPTSYIYYQDVNRDPL